MNYFRIIFVGLGLIPYGFIISLLTFYFHARFIIGRFPSYSFPDPKELDIYPDYYRFIEAGFATWFYTIIFWLLAITVYLIINRKDISWRPVLISASGQVFGILLMFSGIFEWYAD